MKIRQLTKHERRRKPIFRKSYPTVTPSNSYLQEADTCFIKVNINGLWSKEKGLLYYLSDTPILKRRTGYPKNSLGYSTPPQIRSTLLLGWQNGRIKWNRPASSHSTPSPEP